MSITIEGLPLLKPMLAVPGNSFDSPHHLYEVKWDGIRCLAYVGQQTTLFSRNGNDITGRYPELGQLHHAFKQKPLLLDGELVVFEGNKPCFHRLLARDRLQKKDRILQAAAHSPAVLILFDILYLEGESVMQLPLVQRKKLLQDCYSDHPSLKVSEYVAGEGKSFFQAVCGMGLEGMVAKESNSLYLPGKRSSSWVKVKRLLEEDVVICGYTPGKGSRSQLGSLILGGYREGVLTYGGVVGSGFTQRDTVDMLALLQPLVRREPPHHGFPALKNATWVEPRLVCTVRYLERSPAGEIRHGSFLTLRRDKDPRDCLLK